MTLMKPFLIVLSIIMFIVGTIFLVIYLNNRKKAINTNSKESKSNQLNLSLAIIILIGSLLVGSFIFLIY